MKKPYVFECFTDNGEHSHWELLNPETGETLWSENPGEVERPRGILIVGGPSMKISELIGAQLRIMSEISGLPPSVHAGYIHGTASPEVVEDIEHAAVDFARSLNPRPNLEDLCLPVIRYEDPTIENKVPFGPSKNKVLNINTKQHGKSNRNLRASCIRKIPRSRKSN